MPRDLAVSKIPHRSSWLAISMYPELTEFFVALSTVITPPSPSALPNLYSPTNFPHEELKSLILYGRRFALMTSLRLCPSLSHWTRVNGLKVDPGAKPLEDPYALSVL